MMSRVGVALLLAFFTLCNSCTIKKSYKLHGISFDPSTSTSYTKVLIIRPSGISAIILK